MDDLQKELNNVRKDFLKLSSLVSPECNRDVREKTDFDIEEEKLPQISSALSFDGSREFAQSYSARNGSNTSGSNPKIEVKMDSDNDEEEKISKPSPRIRSLGRGIIK